MPYIVWKLLSLSLCTGYHQMGNEVGKMAVCFTGVGPRGDGARRRRTDFAAGKVVADPLDDLGHSFCYIRPELATGELQTTTFKFISGAAVSANASTPLSTAALDLYSHSSIDRASGFEGSTSFSSIPLQPVPRNYAVHSGPITTERGFMSGPLDRGMFSGPMEKGQHDQLRRSYSHGGFALRSRSRKPSLIRALGRALSKGIWGGHNSIVAPIKSVVSMKESDWMMDSEKGKELTVKSSLNFRDERSLHNGVISEAQNLQWAQGKAGEDRVHVVVSEEKGWIFVGIYDGFNGPDAPDYLVSNLYAAIDQELRGLLWDENNVIVSDSCSNAADELSSIDDRTKGCAQLESDSRGVGDMNSKFWHRRKSSKYPGVAKKWEENQRRWRCEWDRERLELERRLKEQFDKKRTNGMSNHCDVLKALSRALKKTEDSYLKLADGMMLENPELALMGSCVLVMLMKGEDVYVMNVGDSRAVLALTKESDLWSQDLEIINEETLYDLEAFDDDDDDDGGGDRPDFMPSLAASQLSKDHSTSIQEEVARIRNEHLDDASVVINDRVKGSLKVTRAFGAGFLKQPKWNEVLLEMFKIDYVGTSSYINCTPSLHHRRLGPRDRFLILSSDGLYQYFTNEEAVSEVELFVSMSPEGDPAQHLVEELLFRAAKRAGMDFYELLEVPQGERRRYHDDVSIIVVSLEGRIWRSSA